MGDKKEVGVSGEGHQQRESPNNGRTQPQRGTAWTVAAAAAVDVCGDQEVRARWRKNGHVCVHVHCANLTSTMLSVFKNDGNNVLSMSVASPNW